MSTHKPVGPDDILPRIAVLEATLAQRTTDFRSTLVALELRIQRLETYLEKSGIIPTYGIPHDERQSQTRLPDR